MNHTNSNSDLATVTLIERIPVPLRKLTSGGDLLLNDTSHRFSCGVLSRPCTTIEPPPTAQEVSYDQISSFSPEPYTLKSPIKIKIVGNDSEYIASFQESNIYASGDTPYEAIENLKSLILDTFDSLTSEPQENLGTKAKHQRALLESIIERQ
jgi:predicted RNase H-like HicB family nuclease